MVHFCRAFKYTGRRNCNDSLFKFHTSNKCSVGGGGSRRWVHPRYHLVKTQTLCQQGVHCECMQSTQHTHYKCVLRAHARVHS